MVFSPNNLLSTFNSPIAQGPANNNQYICVIVPPPSLLAAIAYTATHLRILTTEISLPGRQFATTPFIMYGTSVKMPYGVAYADLSLSFLCTNLMTERNLFDAWQSYISNPLNNFFNYYDNYVGSIYIQKVYNDQPQGVVPFYSILVEEAYPVSVQAQELSYDGEGVLRLTVNFAYRRWRNNLIDKAIFGSVPGVTSPIEGAPLPNTLPTSITGDVVNNPLGTILEAGKLV